MIRYLNATDSEELNNYNIQSSFSLFDDSNYQNTIEPIQTPFRVNKLNTWHIGTFVFDENYPDWIVNVTQNTYSRCRSDREHLITRQSWKLRIVNTAIDYDDKNNQLIHDGHILPCYHSDGFCKPTTKTPYTLTWFDEKFCLIFRLQEFIGRMTRIKDRYWIETNTFIETSNITQKLQTEGIQGTKYPNIKTPQSKVSNPSLSRFEIYPIAQTFCGKPEPLFSTQYDDIFVTYLDGFDMNTGLPKPHSIIDQTISGNIKYDDSNKRYIFPALNISNNFATLDYDAHINTKIDFTINHVFKSMTVQELNTLHTICELERTQLLTILAMSVKNPQLAGFLLTGNRSNFLYVEGSTAWLYDCPHFISPLYKADKCFDRIPIHYRETIMYVDPITRQTFNYATPIECGNNPQNIIELDPDSNDGDFYVLTPEPLKREAPQMFKPTQIKTTITPNTFTAQDAGIYSNAELDQFWNRVLFAKHSDTTLQLLGKSLSYDFISMHNEKHSYSGHNPYNHLRIGVHDHLLNLLPLFNPDWFSQAFINFFGYPCYVLTQCGIYFSTFLFIREVLTFLLKFYRTISIKYNLQSNFSILSSIAQGFFNIVTSEMVTDLNNTGKRKRIYTKHKITTSENDNILLPEKELNNKRRHSDTDSPYLPPKYSSKNSTFQSPQKTHPTNVNDINSQDYDPIMSNVIAVPESPGKVFIKFNPS